MKDIQFEWDAVKAESNLKKHKISFHEGLTVFHDLSVATIPDPSHSETEIRSIAIGISNNGRLLVVSFVDRVDRIRLISCRKATKKEKVTSEEING